MHSLAGGRRLIRPILEMEGLPVILGDIRNTRLTLEIGWHLLTLTWWGMAAVMLYLHYRADGAGTAFLVMTATLFAVSGLTALVASRGRHLSWIFFLPVAAMTAYSAIAI
ncbi:MAG: hypothetical protein ACSHW2_09935 [Parasphingopyxis sp.]